MPIHDPARRLLVIGLDGGSWDILGPLCDLGEMPNLARLRSQGAWSDLLSTLPPVTAPAWSTFLTGVNPGRHSILGFRRKPADPAQSLRNEGNPITTGHLAAPTLWDYLSAAGRNVGAINLPVSYPLRPLNGFAISGMLTPPGATDWTWPPELADELKGYIIELDYGRPGQSLLPDGLPGPGQMLTDIIAMTERLGFHTLRLMQTRPWEVLMTVFTGTDRISHHFWHYLQGDESGGNLDMAVAGQLADFFHLLDSIIGSMVRSAGKDATIVFLSDHGFGPAARHWAHLNNWLLELDLLHLQPVSAGGWLQQIKSRAPWLRDIAKRILPADARAAVQSHSHLADAIDWPRTLAWAEPLYNNIAAIYFHRQDRYPNGVISPAAVETLRQSLIEEARDLMIPGLDRPLVQDIRPREDLYTGPFVENFPDLILTLDPDYAAVPTLGSTLITPIPRLLRTGDHRPEGIFLACGANTRPGRLPHTPSLIDLAPTLLHFAGLPIPTEMEGEPILDAFHDGYLVLHPPRLGPSLPPVAPAPADELSADESAAVNERLRGLGYI
ncbi:MAG: alkaline phosphatase family protein [Caldilineales bacterium]|nr:alkaline phosphatase family protein [Caldilineales bacterium]MCW5858839.1 alkaline phosphatase family protein [Caldilineales bacterium]